MIRHDGCFMFLLTKRRRHDVRTLAESGLSTTGCHICVRVTIIIADLSCNMPEVVQICTDYAIIKCTGGIGCHLECNMKSIPLEGLAGCVSEREAALPRAPLELRLRDGSTGLADAGWLVRLSGDACFALGPLELPGLPDVLDRRGA